MMLLFREYSLLKGLMYSKETLIGIHLKKHGNDPSLLMILNIVKY